MIVGHFFLAAGLTGIIALYKGLDPDQCLKLAAAAGVLALLPDIDIIYSMKELSTFFVSGFYDFTDSFWKASQVVHRGITHSLLTLSLTTVASIAYHRTRSTMLAVTTVVFTALGSFYLDGMLAAALTSLFSATALFTISKLKNYSTADILTALTTGLIIHPFGDIFTGVPPDFLYPLSIKILSSRIIPFEDPVLNFFTVLTLELAAIWFAINTYAVIKSKNILTSLKPLSLIGAAYILFAQMINTPTMSTGYQFVFSIIVISFVASYAVRIRNKEIVDYFILIVNFVMAMTLASFVYLIQYIV